MLLIIIYTTLKYIYCNNIKSHKKLKNTFLFPNLIKFSIILILEK